MIKLTDLIPSICILDIPVRLASGPNPDEGRVEIYWNKAWGNIYSSVWTYEYAKIICQQLGYKYTLSAVQEGYFKGDDVPVHTRDVYCLGNETKLAECQITFWPSNANHHDSPRGVRCSNYDPSQGIVGSYYVTVNLCSLFLFKICCKLSWKSIVDFFYIPSRNSFDKQSVVQAWSVSSCTGPWLDQHLLSNNCRCWVACSFCIVRDWLLLADKRDPLVCVVCKRNFCLALVSLCHTFLDSKYLLCSRYGFFSSSFLFFTIETCSL